MTIAEQLEQKGIEQGIEKGEREATLKIARAMLQKGMDFAAIMEMTGLSKEDLAKFGH